MQNLQLVLWCKTWWGNIWDSPMDHKSPGVWDAKTHLNKTQNQRVSDHHSLGTFRGWTLGHLHRRLIEELVLLFRSFHLQQHHLPDLTGHHRLARCLDGLFLLRICLANLNGRYAVVTVVLQLYNSMHVWKRIYIPRWWTDVCIIQ